MVGEEVGRLCAMSARRNWWHTCGWCLLDLLLWTFTDFTFYRFGSCKIWNDSVYPQDCEESLDIFSERSEK